MQQHVAASTQNQALSALLFLYTEVLQQPLAGPVHTVLTREEVRRVLDALAGGAAGGWTTTGSGVGGSALGNSVLLSPSRSGPRPRARGHRRNHRGGKIGGMLLDAVCDQPVYFCPCSCLCLYTPSVQEEQTPAASYKPGDHVRARASALLVPAGTLGTVTAVYLTMPDACEVYFNGQLAAILWTDELERANRPADDTPQP